MSVLFAVASVSLLSATTSGAPRSVRAPMVCSRGPSGQFFSASLTLPPAAPTGSTVTVRIDSVSSGLISHTGLNYIFDMVTHYPVPPGTTFVAGSARVVPDTGTANVRPGARVWHDAEGLHFWLPSRVPNGSSYTPPSLEFSLRIDAPAGSQVALQFSRYQVTANAFLVGDVRTICEPTPKPYALTVMHVTPAVSPP